MTPRAIPLLLLLVLLTACTPENNVSTPIPAQEATAVATQPPIAATECDEPTPSATMTIPTNTVDIEASGAVAPCIADVTFAGANGLVLHATYYRPGGLPPFAGVILLHMLGDDRSVWSDARTGFAHTLMHHGYAVLAVDMRGHGDSGARRDWGLAETDLQQAWLALTAREEVDAARTAVIGASIGSNMALRTAAIRPDVKTAVLLSPGLDYRRVTTEDALAVYGDRPLLIVASRDDSYSADSSVALHARVAETAVLLLYDTAGHGTHMFAAQPELTDTLVDWLNTHVRELP